jgi:zinc protease
MRELYGEHPYARTLMGTEESLGTMLPEELAAHWRSLLDPRNVVIALAGDVEFERAVERLKTLFGGLKPGKFKTAKHLDPALPAGVLQVSATRKKEQTHILLGLLGCRIGSPDEYALHLLNATLSGQGGRLFVELRDKLHLAYNVHSFFREGVERGTFGVYIATSTANADQAVAATLDHLRQVVQRPPRGKELARAKRYLIGSQQLDLQTAGSLSLTIGLNELLGVGYRAHQQLAEKIRRITDAQMATIVRRYLTLDRMVIARVGEK